MSPSLQLICVPAQFPRASQTSFSVQGSPSLHPRPATGVLTHAPVVSSHESSVHSLSSSQSTGVLTHTPSTQVSVVQGLASSQLTAQPPQLAGSFSKSGLIMSPCALCAGTALPSTSMITNGFVSEPVR